MFLQCTVKQFIIIYNIIIIHMSYSTLLICYIIIIYSYCSIKYSTTNYKNLLCCLILLIFHKHEGEGEGVREGDGEGEGEVEGERDGEGEGEGEGEG